MISCKYQIKFKRTLDMDLNQFFTILMTITKKENVVERYARN